MIRQRITLTTVRNCLTLKAGGNENFIKNIKTGDKTWVYGYGVEVEAQSSQWVGKGSPQPKKACMSRSNMKVILLVFFD